VTPIGAPQNKPKFVVVPKLPKLYQHALKMAITWNLAVRATTRTLN